MESSGSTYLQGIILGFVLGVSANWVFAVILRLLPDQWVRYKVQIERLQELEDGSFRLWWARTKIARPFWLKRIFLKEPLMEYLGVELKIDNGEWTRTKWERGDVNEYRSRADGVGMINALAFTVSRPSVYLADNMSAGNAIQEGKHALQLRVTRLLDSKVAAEKQFSFVVGNGGLKVESG